jgi:hypothetical protein
LPLLAGSSPNASTDKGAILLQRGSVLSEKSW